MPIVYECWVCCNQCLLCMSICCVWVLSLFVTNTCWNWYLLWSMLCMNVEFVTINVCCVQMFVVWVCLLLIFVVTDVVVYECKGCCDQCLLFTNVEFVATNIRCSLCCVWMLSLFVTATYVVYESLLCISVEFVVINVCCVWMPVVYKCCNYCDCVRLTFV